jgi:hypothetical protein
MGNVLEFPSQQAKGLAYLDRQLRSLLTAKGADEQLIDFAVNQLTRIYARVNNSEHYSFTLDLPQELSTQQRAAMEQQINQGLDDIRRENHAVMLELIAQLVLAEVKLFQVSRE